MKTVAILYTSKFGQTKSIAYFMLSYLLSKDLHVQIYDVMNRDLPANLETNVDALIMLAPVYRGKFNPRFLNWVRSNLATISKRQTAFCSVSLNAADRKPESRAGDDRILQAFTEETGLRPDFVASFAGAVKYQEYNFFIRTILKWISKSANGPIDTKYNYILTDWSLVETFLGHFIANDKLCSFSTPVRLPKDFGVIPVNFIDARGGIAAQR